jgi:hypothetical protein
MRFILRSAASSFHQTSDDDSVAPQLKNTSCWVRHNLFKDLDADQRKALLADLAEALRAQANKPQSNPEFQRLLNLTADELEAMIDDIAATGTDVANAIIDEAIILLSSIQSKLLDATAGKRTLH